MLELLKRGGPGKRGVPCTPIRSKGNHTFHFIPGYSQAVGDRLSEGFKVKAASTKHPGSWAKVYTSLLPISTMYRSTSTPPPPRSLEQDA